MARKRKNSRSRSQRSKKTTSDQLEQNEGSNSGSNQGSARKRTKRGKKVKTTLTRSERSSGGNQCMHIAGSLSFKHEPYRNDPIALLTHMIAGAVGFLSPDIYYDHATTNINEWKLPQESQTRLNNIFCGEDVHSFPNHCTVWGLWAIGGPNFRCRISVDDNRLNTDKIPTEENNNASSIECGAINFFRAAFYRPETEVKQFFGPERTDSEKDLDDDNFIYLWLKRLMNLKTTFHEFVNDKNFNGDDRILTFNGTCRMPNNTQFRAFNQQKSIHDFMRNIIIYAHDRINAALNETDDYGADVGYSLLSHKEITRSQIDVVIENYDEDEPLFKWIQQVTMREEMKPYDAYLNHRGGVLLKSDTVLSSTTKRGKHVSPLQFVKQEAKRLKNLIDTRNNEVIRYFRYLLQTIEATFKSRKDLLRKWGYYYMEVNGVKKNYYSLLKDGSRHGVLLATSAMHAAPEEKLAPVQIASNTQKYLPRDMEWWKIAMNVEMHHLVEERLLKRKVMKQMEDKHVSDWNGYVKMCAASRSAKEESPSREDITKHTKRDYEQGEKMLNIYQFRQILGHDRRGQTTQRSP